MVFYEAIVMIVVFVADTSGTTRCKGSVWSSWKIWSEGQLSAQTFVIIYVTLHIDT